MSLKNPRNHANISEGVSFCAAQSVFIDRGVAPTGLAHGLFAPLPGWPPRVRLALAMTDVTDHLNARRRPRIPQWSRCVFPVFLVVLVSLRGSQYRSRVSFFLLGVAVGRSLLTPKCAHHPKGAPMPGYDP